MIVVTCSIILTPITSILIVNSIYYIMIDVIYAVVHIDKVSVNINDVTVHIIVIVVD